MWCHQVSQWAVGGGALWDGGGVTGVSPKKRNRRQFISGWFNFNTVLRKAKDQTSSLLWAWGSGPWMTWMAFSNLKNLMILYSDFPSFSSFYRQAETESGKCVYRMEESSPNRPVQSLKRYISATTVLNTNLSIHSFFKTTLIVKYFDYAVLLFTYDLICRLNMWLPMMLCLPWGLWCWLVHRWKDMRWVVSNDAEAYHRQTWVSVVDRKTLLQRKIWRVFTGESASSS